MIKTILGTLAAAFVLSFATPNAIADPVKGRVVLSHVSPSDALLIWDATTRITDLTAHKITSAQGQQALTADAVNILASRAPSLKSKRISITVVYILSRQMLLYGKPSMAARGTLLSVSANRADVAKLAVVWLSSIRAGKTPQGLAVRRLGVFPTTY